VLVDIHLPGMGPVTYEHVTPEMVPVIVQEHILNGQVVDKWAAKKDYYDFYKLQKGMF